MSDLIDRQAILKNIEKIRQSVQMMDDTHRASIIMTGMHLCEEAVMNQPSAERKGKWIEDDDYEYGENVWRCSVCGEPYVLIEGTPKQNQFYFCPNCGARMVRGSEDE